MVAALVKLALAGDVAALRLALGPFLPPVKQEVEVSGVLTFADLTRAARRP